MLVFKQQPPNKRNQSDQNWDAVLAGDAQR